MSLIAQVAFGPNYAAAERFAEEWAGDNDEHAAVVEDFDLGDPTELSAGAFLVMEYAAADEYTAEHNADIVFHADHTPDRTAARDWYGTPNGNRGE